MYACSDLEEAILEAPWWIFFHSPITLLDSLYFPFPIAGADLIKWHMDGFFGLDLPVKAFDASPGTEFVPLGDVMPHLRPKAAVPPGFATGPTGAPATAADDAASGGATSGAGAATGTAAAVAVAADNANSSGTAASAGAAGAVAGAGDHPVQAGGSTHEGPAAEGLKSADASSGLQVDGQHPGEGHLVGDSVGQTQEGAGTSGAPDTGADAGSTGNNKLLEDRAYAGDEAAGSAPPMSIEEGQSLLAALGRMTGEHQQPPKRQHGAGESGITHQEALGIAMGHFSVEGQLQARQEQQEQQEPLPPPPPQQQQERLFVGGNHLLDPMLPPHMVFESPQKAHLSVEVTGAQQQQQHPQVGHPHGPHLPSPLHPTGPHPLFGLHPGQQLPPHLAHLAHVSPPHPHGVLMGHQMGGSSSSTMGAL